MSSAISVGMLVDNATNVCVCVHVCVCVCVSECVCACVCDHIRDTHQYKAPFSVATHYARDRHVQVQCSSSTPTVQLHDTVLVCKSIVT